MQITIDQVPFGDKILVRYEPASLDVKRSGCGKYFDVEVDDLGMYFTESSPSTLRAAIHAVLKVKWERLVLQDPSEMTPRARARRSQLEETYSFG